MHDSQPTFFVNSHTQTRRTHQIQLETQHVSMDLLAIYRKTTYHFPRHYGQRKMVEVDWGRCYGATTPSHLGL
jgi:hypothetical protein